MLLDLFILGELESSLLIFICGLILLINFLMSFDRLSSDDHKYFKRISESDEDEKRKSWSIIFLKYSIYFFSIIFGIIFLFYPFSSLLYPFSLQPTTIQNIISGIHSQMIIFPYFHFQDIILQIISCVLSPFLYCLLGLFLVEILNFSDEWRGAYEKDKKFISSRLNEDFKLKFDINFSGEAHKKEILIYERLEFQLSFNMYLDITILDFYIEGSGFNYQKEPEDQFPLLLKSGTVKIINYTLKPKEVGKVKFNLMIKGKNEDFGFLDLFLFRLFNTKYSVYSSKTYTMKINPPPPRLITKAVFNFNNYGIVKFKMSNEGSTAAKNIRCITNSLKDIKIVQDFKPVKIFRSKSPIIGRDFIFEPSETGNHLISFDIKYYDIIGNSYEENNVFEIKFNYQPQNLIEKCINIETVEKMEDQDLRLNLIKDDFDSVINKLKSVFPIPERNYNDIIDILEEKLGMTGPFEYRDYFGSILLLLAEGCTNLSQAKKIASIAEKYVDDRIGNRYKLEMDCVITLVFLSEVWKPHIELSSDINGRIEKIAESQWDFKKITIIKDKLPKIERLKSYIDKHDVIKSIQGAEDIDANVLKEKTILIFVSYAREDITQAERIFISLNEIEHFKVWFDKENLLPGQNWENEIYKAIDVSHFVILILSTNSVEKTGYIQKEIRIVLERYFQMPPGKIFLIPVRIDNCNIPHRELKKLHHVDMFPDWDRGFQKVVKAIIKEIK